MYKLKFLLVVTFSVLILACKKFDVQKPRTSNLMEKPIGRLLYTKTHGIWASIPGTGGKYNILVNVKDDKVEEHLIAPTENQGVISIHELDGKVEALLANGKLFQLENDTFIVSKLYEKVVNDLSITIFKDIVEDKDQNVWISSANGLVKFRDNKTELFDLSEFNPMANKDIRDIAVDNKGNLWAIHASYGLAKYDNGNFKSFSPLNGRLPAYTYYKLERGIDKKIWVVFDDGTRDGVLSFDGSNTQEYDLFPVNNPSTFEIDGQGNMWVGYWNQGIYAYNNKRWEKVISLTQDFPSNFVNNMFQVSTNYLIVSTVGGIAAVRRVTENDSYLNARYLVIDLRNNDFLELNRFK